MAWITAIGLVRIASETNVRRVGAETLNGLAVRQVERHKVETDPTGNLARRQDVIDANAQNIIQKRNPARNEEVLDARS